MPAFQGFQSHIGSHGQSRQGQDCTPGHHAAWSWVTFMLLSGCGYATLIGSAAFWRVGVYSFALSQSIPPSLVVLLFGELGYIHFLFPNLFDFTSTPICRVFPEAPLLIRWISPSLLMDLVIFVNL